MLEPVDRKDVNRALREIVWPILKREGFARRTDRTAWRDRPDQVDVVTFWSHNAYNAGVFRISTLSFQLHLAVHPRCRTTAATPSKNGRLQPPDAACDFRRILVKPTGQVETDRPEIWFVRPDGTNLHEVVENARDALMSVGLDWFASLDGLGRMLDVARHEPLNDYTAAGMGNLGSPFRERLIVDLEAALPS